MMSEDRWERIKAVFDAVMSAPASEREATLDRACGGDVELRREIESLLDARTHASLRTGGAASALAGAIAGSGLIAEQRGDVIGRYTLLRPIGEGGFGSVWMAEQREPVTRRVALKIIKVGMDTRQVIARFEAERQALAMMDHPNIAKVFDAGSTETGRPYFVMEYIEGDPICAHCNAAKLDTRARLDLFMMVCHAIQHAHQKGIIHRDIKPSNVLVTMHDGVPVPKVIDFGIAKATSSELTTRTLFTEHRQVVGTPVYMSPEQAEMSGLDIDTRSDIYSLGVLLYELLTGTTPFAHEDLMSKGFAEMMRIIREVEPPKPSTRLNAIGQSGSHAAQPPPIGGAAKLGMLVRGDLDWIVMKCLEKDRTRRYDTANELATDIKRHLNDETVSAAAPSASYRLRKFVKRNRAKVIAGSIVTGALVLGVIGTSVGLAWALNERNKATLAADAEALATIAAKENEQRAMASAKAAEASKEEEAKARKRAETISAFVAAALQSSDAQRSTVAGAPGAAGAASFDMTILAAMDNAIKDLDSGRFKDDPETEAALRSTIGVILRNNGKYDKARPLLEKALEMRTFMSKGEDSEVAEILSELAELHFRQGDYAQAEALYRRALEIHERVHGPDHPRVAVQLNSLVVVYRTQGRYTEAEAFSARGLAIAERAFGPDDPEVATGLSSLALLKRAQGHYAQAEPLLTRALAIREKALGPDNPAVAGSLSNLALIHMNQSQYDKAEPFLTRALAIRERTLGADHPEVATILNNLAVLVKAQSNEAKAEQLHLRALAIREKALGADHTDVSQSLNNLAELYKTQGKFAQAEPLYTRALAIDEKVLGREHPEVATDLNNLSSLQKAQANYAQAEELATRALAIREKALGAEHSDVAQSLNNLAELHKIQGHYDKAEPLLVRSLAIHEKSLGPDHPDVAVALNNLAGLYLATRQYDKAEPLYARSLAIREGAKGSDHPSVAIALNNLAALYQAKGQFAQAEPLNMRALAINTKAFGPNHLSVAQSLSALARSQHALDKTAEARQGLDEAIGMFRSLSPSGSPTFARVLWQSGSARLDQGDAAAALKELEEALTMGEKFLKPDHAHLKEYRDTLARCRRALAQ